MQREDVLKLIAVMAGPLCRSKKPLNCTLQKSESHGCELYLNKAGIFKTRTEKGINPE